MIKMLISILKASHIYRTFQGQAAVRRSLEIVFACQTGKYGAIRSGEIQVKLGMEFICISLARFLIKSGCGAARERMT